MSWGYDDIWTISAILESSMLNALTRYLTKPLKYYDLEEKSDILWVATDKLDIQGVKHEVVVVQQNERPDDRIRNIEIHFRIIETDQRDPVLLESIMREEGGFKRVPGKIQF